MSRRRFIYDPERKEMVEVGADWSDTERRAPVTTEGLTYGNLRATDGTPIDTRKRHREYLKATGSAMSSDFTETRARAATERAEMQRTGGDHKERRETLGRALYSTTTQRGRR